MTPIQQALGNDWIKLNPLMQNHFETRAAKQAPLIITGHLDVKLSSVGKIFAIVGKVFNALVPYSGKGISVIVKNWFSDKDQVLHWHRTFSQDKPAIFRSRMVFEHSNQIIEWTGPGLGIRLRCFVINGAFSIVSNGYVWRIGSLIIPLPEWLLLGKAIATESQVSENRIRIQFEMQHPLWGRTFAYSGELTVHNTE